MNRRHAILAGIVGLIFGWFVPLYALAAGVIAVWTYSILEEENAASISKGP